MKIEIGTPYSFRPTAFSAAEHCGLRIAPVLHGRVIYINCEHGYFTAEAMVNGHVLRESFKGALATRLADCVKVRHGYRH